MKGVKKIRRRAKRKPYTFNKNAIANRNKRYKERKKIGCDAVEEDWDGKETVKGNLERMGLVYDLNEAIPIPKAKANLRNAVASTSSSSLSSPDNQGRSAAAVKEVRMNKADSSKRVIDKLVDQAGLERPQQPRLSVPQVNFAVYLIEKHGDDYVRMTRDPKNHYQETAKQLKKKIDYFKTSHQYNAYLTAKQNVAKERMASQKRKRKSR